MAPMSDARIKAALKSGEAAFWEAVAKEFPEATSGDLDPHMTVTLARTMESAIWGWVDHNVNPEGNGDS